MRAIGFGIVLSVVAAASSAGAETSSEVASRLFAEGEAAHARGEYAVAARAFDSAFQAVPHAAAAFNAGREWDAAGDELRAAADYDRALGRAELDPKSRAVA